MRQKNLVLVRISDQRQEGNPPPPDQLELLLYGFSASLQRQQLSFHIRSLITHSQARLVEQSY
jgi:hypothetical protein